MINSYLKMVGLFMVWIFSVVNVWAQWNSDLSKNLLISEEGKSKQDLVNLGETTDGSVYVSWISWENDNYYLKLQLLDKEGKCMFAPGGIYVCKQPTPPWSSGYGFTVTKDNGVVIVSTDMRNNEWQAYVYKISSKGEHVWSSEGAPIMSVGEGSALNPKVIETQAGNYIIGYRAMGVGVARLSFMKLSAEGTTSWGSKLDIVGAGDLFNIVPSGKDGFIAAYFINNSYYAQRYNATGDEVWAEKAEIDNTELAKVTSDPYVMSDGEGGFVTGWRYSASAYKTAGKAQHIDADGKSVFEDVFLTENLPYVWVDTSAKQIYILSSNPIASSIFEPKIWKTDFQGVDMWTPSGVVMSEQGLSYAAYGMAVCSNGDLICVYRNGSEYNEATIEYTRINKEGTVIKQNELISNAAGDKGRGGLSSVKNGQVIVAWADNSAEVGGMVFVQNMKVEDPSDIFSSKKNDSGIIAYSTSQGQLTLSVQSATEAIANISLLGMNGERIVELGKVALLSGDNKINYDLSGVSKGIYLLSVNTQKDNGYVKVIVM